MKKMFSHLLVFALLLSFFTSLLDTAAAMEQRNPISLNWEFKRDVDGVRIDVAITPRKASDDTRAKSYLCAFWRFHNSTGKDIHLQIRNRVYNTSAGVVRIVPPSQLIWDIYLKSGETTESTYQSHLFFNDFVHGDPTTKCPSVDFTAEIMNQKNDDKKNDGKIDITGAYETTAVSNGESTNITTTIKDIGGGKVQITVSNESTGENLVMPIMSYNRNTNEISFSGPFSNEVTIKTYLKFSRTNQIITATGSVIVTVGSYTPVTVNVTLKKM